MRFLALLGALVLDSGSSCWTAAVACTGLADGFPASVAEVVDAQTLRLHDGAQLRLAGILTPHPEDVRAAPRAWPGAVAARAEVEALVLGKTVTIAFGAERRDRYGRHLGHAFVGADASVVQRVWLQGHLLAQGLARVVPRAQDRACDRVMLDIEAAARGAGLGIWAQAAYRIRQAQDIDAITALTGTFQIIEGTVVQTRRAGANLRLDFAERGRFGFSALVPRTKGARDAGPSPGTRVRLRGYVEERGGRPVLDLSVVGSLDVLEPAAGIPPPDAAAKGANADK